MRATVLTLLAATLWLVPVRAQADVEVKPVPWSPSIHIHAKHQAEVDTANPIRAQVDHKPTIQCSAAGGDMTICFSEGAITLTDNPDALPAQILQAVREIGLPGLEVRLQPGTSTLVNAETIFYAQPQPFRRSIDLLGFDIEVEAEPVRYHWIHGDGTASTTRRPGKPYPAMDVTYRYREPADNVRPRVDVTYRVRYRVDGDAWRTLAQTLLAPGPAADLEVKEAAPVLTTP